NYDGLICRTQVDEKNNIIVMTDYKAPEKAKAGFFLRVVCKRIRPPLGWSEI
ncbi:MAG: hypothetical protein IE881_03275, partial [Epsilonproteobacteria bacterium]|nr:hypothetical protein [Campylobacterota bacterium]